jgi:hypothetical protein
MFFVEAPAKRKTQVAPVTAATAAANTAVVVTLAAVAGYRHHVPQVIWSYSAAPTGGRLSVSGLDDTQTLDFDITAGGPGAILFPPLVGKVNTAVVITLAAGSGAVVGKLNVFHVALPAVDMINGQPT